MWGSIPFTPEKLPHFPPERRPTSNGILPRFAPESLPHFDRNPQRFRKSFKVILGLRLNVSRAGLSATMGSSPFSVNVGPRGIYSNVSIPGTGLSNRQRLDTPSSSRPTALPAVP